MFRKQKSIKELLPPPVQVEHGEYSMILSARDHPAKLTPTLLKVSLKGIEFAAKAELKDITTRSHQAKSYGHIWPGEHYRLLMGLIKAIKPEIAIEIGTSTGLSALSIKKALLKKGKLITFDIRKWSEYPNTLFHEADFDERLEQRIGDISDMQTLEMHRQVFEKASFIFIDATHDGSLEEKILKNLSTIAFKSTTYLFFDDIRVWTMLKMWREISFPKLDLTSFGHWSGSGIVEMPSSVNLLDSKC